MPRLKKLGFLLRNDLQHFTNDNLHHIAISNLDDGQKALERWWADKYKRPIRDFDDHTIEELLVEMYEDYYRKNPTEIQRFIDSTTQAQEEWDGRMSDEHESHMRARWAKKPKLDLSKWQDDRELTEEEERKIFDSIGRNLPGSRKTINMGEDDGGFNEDFLGGES